MTVHRKIVVMSFVLLSTAIMGCAKGGNGDGGNGNDGIPEKLSFVPQSGQALTAQDYDDLNALIKDSNSERPSSYLIKAKEISDQHEQQEKLNKQPKKYKAALNKLSNMCTITQPSTQQLADFDLAAGQNHSATLETSSIDGGGCPVSYSSKVKADLNILSFNKDTKTGLMRGAYDAADTESICASERFCVK